MVIDVHISIYKYSNELSISSFSVIVWVRVVLKRLVMSKWMSGKKHLQGDKNWMIPL